MVKCECGVWKVEDIPCWNETDRKQLSTEAYAELSQAFRNLGHQLIKSMPTVKKAEQAIKRIFK